MAGPASHLPGTPAGTVAARTGLVVALVAFVWLLVVGGLRYYDRDEGFYAIAADQVRHGAHPWRDFFYPQGPLLPLVLAPTGGDIDRMRRLAALAGAVAAGLIAARIARRQGPGTAALATVMLLGSWHVATWFATTKTQPYATALSVGALLLVTGGARTDGRSSFLRSAAAGAVLGIATLVRLPCLALLAPSALWMWLAAPAGGRLRALTGTATMAVTSAGLFALGAWPTGADLAQMVFNLAGYHANPVAHPWAQRVGVALELLVEPQVLALLGCGLTATVIALRRRQFGDDHLAAGLAALTLTAGYALARPTWPQYFAFSAPFWVWAAAPVWHRLARRPTLGVAIAGVWILLGPVRHHRDIFVSPFPHQGYFSRAEVEAVHEVLARLPPGSEVASPWPGYIAATGHRPVPGLESTHGIWAARRLDAAHRRHYRLLSADELEARLEARPPAAVVVNREDLGYRLVDLDRLRSLYQPPIQVGSTLVLVRRGGPGGAEPATP